MADENRYKIAISKNLVRLYPISYTYHRMNKNADNVEKRILKKLDEMPKEVSDLFHAKKYDKCASFCEKILAEDPQSILAHLYIGTIFESRNDYEKAIVHYSRIVEDFPEFYLASAAKGLAQFEVHDYKGARNSFLKYLEYHDCDGKVWGITAQLENILSGRRNAMQILDEAERRTTVNKDLIYRARGAILLPTDPDSALLSFIQAQEAATEETQKEKYGKDIYNLVLKHIDPLKRTGMNQR